MNKYYVEAIDVGCDCCSWVTVAEFDTLEEAMEFAGDDNNLSIYEEKWDEEWGENE